MRPNRRSPSPLQRRVNAFVLMVCTFALGLFLVAVVMWGIAESEECRIFVADGMPNTERRMP